MSKIKKFSRRLQKGLLGIPSMMEGVKSELSYRGKMFQENIAPYKKMWEDAPRRKKKKKKRNYL